MLLAPGQLLNQTYRVDSFVGAGAFGEVYVVTHRFLGEQALKTITLPPNTDSESIFSEARILVDLNHRHIVRTYDANICFTTNSPFGFMTMEYAPQGTLAEMITGRMKLSESETLVLGLQLADALQATHNRPSPLLHLDIKPSNILVFKADQGTLFKLSDFGVARSLDPETRLVRSAGTAAYAPPEMAWGIADERSDIYSLGVTLYRCLTGIHPFPIYSTGAFESRDLRATLSQGRRSIIVPSRQLLRPRTPLDEVIMGCLEYDLFDRFKNASELFKSLKNINDMSEATSP